MGEIQEQQSNFITFERFVDVSSEEVATLVVFFCVRSIRNSVLSDVNNRVVVALLDEVQQTTQAPWNDQQPLRAGPDRHENRLSVLYLKISGVQSYVSQLGSRFSRASKMAASLSGGKPSACSIIREE